MTTNNELITNSDMEIKIRNMEGGDAFLSEFYNVVKSSIVAQITSNLDDITQVTHNYKSNKAESLPSEIYDVVQSILDTLVSTKDELRAITELAQERDIDGFTDVEDTLVAIVNDTERATNVILDNVEKITDAIRENTSPIEGDTLSDYIQRTATDIILACSFQDITGQRIQKIVDVINEVDNKIHYIEEKLSGNQSSFDRTSQKEMGLLDGPALPNSTTQVSQNDIDGLFD